MTSRDFCYWLQGWFELNKTIDHREGASKETMESIQRHLSMVFKHEIDPSFGDEKKQEELTKIHEGFSPLAPGSDLFCTTSTGLPFAFDTDITTKFNC